MCDAIEMRIVAVIDLTNNLGIGGRFVGANCDRTVQADAFDGVLEKSLCGFGIAPGGQAEIDYLSVRINSPPQIAPFASNTD